MNHPAASAQVTPTASPKGLTLEYVSDGKLIMEDYTWAKWTFNSFDKVIE
jgi:hypothetical protein